MAIDHSLTYRKISLRNLVHIFRLKRTLSVIRSCWSFPVQSYADVGCSNGYITSILSEVTGARRSAGFDHTQKNLEAASANYPEIDFRFMDLNRPADSAPEKFQCITCLETMEHVGDMESALQNINNMMKGCSSLIISVPIEIGFFGALKFLAKTIIYNDSLEELRSKSDAEVTWMGYFRDLLLGRRMEMYRRKDVNGWGTHFGFDYRFLDELVRARFGEVQLFNYLTTRYYLITKANEREQQRYAKKLG